MGRGKQQGGVEEKRGRDVERNMVEKGERDRKREL